jgi:hypothetical protein
MLLHTSDCTTARHVLGAVLQLTNEHELARIRMLALSDIPRDGVNGGRESSARSRLARLAPVPRSIILQRGEGWQGIAISARSAYQD